MKNSYYDAEQLLHATDEKEKEYINKLAPIVLFAYNRPDHVKQVVELLEKNCSNM